MPRLQYKTFATPDEVRAFPNGRAEVVTLDESVVGRAVYEPGWRWSTSMGAIAGTASCQLHHLGYSISGVMHVVTEDGQTIDIPPSSIYEIPPGHDAWVDGDEPFITVDWTSARVWAVTPEVLGEGEIVTVLLTDIVGSTAIVREIGDEAWRQRQTVHHLRMRDHLNVFRGREIKSTGDGLLAVFDRPAKAVRCAGAMAASSREMNLPIRAGVHTGEVEFIGDDARGLAVHTAARVMSLGDADDVMVSSTTRELLEGSGIELEDAGEHELKGLPGVRRIFRLAH